MLVSSTIPAVGQQSLTVSGTVIDASDGSTLPGVNVVVKGAPARGTSTDEDGRYTLQVPSSQDTLLFSFVGYVTQEVAVEGRETIDVELQVSVQLLEDVVVVGYGTQERKQVTGSVSSVREDEFVKGNINNATQLIQGKVPGLIVSTDGGDPNSNPTVRLRGISSFGANQDPLVVVDGVIGASLDNIDPNDIASIDVLKDASASAIYGTRGSAGVILVTTKKGVVTAGGEGVEINYNAYATLETIENQLDVLSASEFRRFAQENNISITDNGASTDWSEEISQNGVNNVHSLAISGGDANTTYRVSGNFRDRDGIQKKTGFQQINGRINITQKALEDNLTIDFNIGATNREANLGFNEAFRYAVSFNPTNPVEAPGFENTGGFSEIAGFDIFNPKAIIETGTNRQERKNFLGSARAQYDFSDYLIQGLTASVSYSLETVNTIQRTFFSQRSKFGGGATQAALGEGEARQKLTDDQNELFETTVNYLGSAGNLNVEVLGGYSWQNFINEGNEIIAGNFTNDAVSFNNLAFAEDIQDGEATITSFKNTNRLIAGFGRLSLNWDDTYFLNGSYRREGSSRFGANEQWGDFWSVGGSVEITNLVEINSIDRLKVRASFGQTGQNAPFDGISIRRFEPGGSAFIAGNPVTSLRLVSNPNPDLKWELKKEFNIGAEVELLDYRLVATVEYYNQTTEDLLFPVEVPSPPSPFPTTWRNVGELETQGVELSFDYAAIRQRDLNWKTTVTTTFFGDTKLNKFISDDSRFIAEAGSPGAQDFDMVRVKEGENIGEFWLAKFSRFSDAGEFLCENPDGSEVLCNSSAAVRQGVGNGLPTFQFGWTNAVSYKNWDLSVFLRGVFGHDILNMNSFFRGTREDFGTKNILQSATDIPQVNTRGLPTSRNVEDGDFLRMESLTLGYNVPLGEIRQIKRLRLYFSANNLFTITGYDGIDPEVNYFDPGNTDNAQSFAFETSKTDPEIIGGEAGGALAPGIERRNEWFTVRSFTIGINLDL